MARIAFSSSAPCVAPQQSPDTIYLDGTWMVNFPQTQQDLRPRAADSEKITINLGYVDLGQIDLLVQEGFYTNRTDFIRTAIRAQLDRHGDALRQAGARHQLELGLCRYSRAELEALREAGSTIHIHVLGLAIIASDVTPDLALATIASLHVLGALQASPEVKAALRPRFR
jgi:Arc/MetJ-type ribon-helix-helix transcriptional regulator